MKPYAITITTPAGVTRLEALARCSADALAGVLGQVPVGARVSVRAGVHPRHAITAAAALGAGLALAAGATAELAALESSTVEKRAHALSAEVAQLRERSARFGSTLAACMNGQTFRVGDLFVACEPTTVRTHKEDQ